MKSTEWSVERSWLLFWNRGISSLLSYLFHLSTFYVGDSNDLWLTQSLGGPRYVVTTLRNVRKEDVLFSLYLNWAHLWLWFDFFLPMIIHLTPFWSRMKQTRPYRLRIGGNQVPRFYYTNSIRQGSQQESESCPDNHEPFALFWTRRFINLLEISRH